MKATLLLFSLLILIGCGQTNTDTTTTLSTPKKLLVYYGWPSSINGSSGSTSNAITEFSAYDIIVLGDGLEASSHGDHDNTVSIISGLSGDVFGYVDLGVTTQGLSIASINAKVDLWKDMGVAGIFLDDYGYDFEVTRTRQNTVVDYIHDQSLTVIANAWDPDDVFSPTTNATYNPDSTATTMTANDYYLAESFMITVGAYASANALTTKMDKIISHQSNVVDFKVLALTTNDSTNDYSESKFFYAWYGAQIYGLEAIGWGEYNFSSGDSNATYRTRPSIDPGTYYSGDITLSNDILSRTTELGTLEVDLSNHTYSFY